MYFLQLFLIHLSQLCSYCTQNLFCPKTEELALKKFVLTPRWITILMYNITSFQWPDFGLKSLFLMIHKFKWGKYFPDNTRQCPFRFPEYGNLLTTTRKSLYPWSKYMFKVINKRYFNMLKVLIVNKKDTPMLCPKLNIKSPERRNWHRFIVFIVKFE